MSETTKRVHAEVSRALTQLEKLFVPEARLSFIMRVPGNPESFMFISNEKPGDLIETLQLAATKEAV